MKENHYKLLLACMALLFTFASKAQRVTTIVGNGTAGYSGDGGQATAAEISSPGEVALDGAGNLYLCDAGNNRIRKVSTAGVISTIVGNGTAGFSGDGGQATAAEISGPAAAIVDASGNLYVVDAANNRVRKVNTSGVISTIAGNGTAGYSGDGGQATAAELSNPQDIVIDASGNIYITDFANHRVRKINTSGVISTIAGNGTSGYSGDGGQATGAELTGPSGMEFDASGNLYLADRTNNRIRMINTSGVISTICGNGTAGFTGDGGQATAAELSNPTAVDIDATGNLYITDRNNNRIRKIYVSGIITTVAGNGTAGYSGDGGAATSAEFSGPAGIVDTRGNLYIGDRANNRIRKITYSQTFYFKTVSSGNFSDATIWQASQDGSTDWNPVLNPPNYRSSGIVISSGDSVVFNSTDTLDQVTVNGVLNYGTGCTLELNNGSGVDLAVTSSGKFYDNGDNAIIWNSATWNLAGGAYLIRTRSTSSDNFRDQYDGGISTIPATSYWIVRKTGSDNPTISSLSSMQYGNLYIENTTGTTWVTPSGSSFTGSSNYPIIKGNMSIGGTSSGNVSFLDTNTNAATTLVQGNFTVNSGSVFRNHGTGFEVQGNVTLNGADSTSSTSVIKLSGSNTQTLSGSNLSFKNLRIHKTSTAATVSLTAACTIRGSLKLDTGVIVSDTVHLLTFNAGSTATGVNPNAFVSGPVKKIGNTAFTFPIGKGSSSQTIGISAPSNTTDAFQAEYFTTNPVTVYGNSSDTTFNYISTCQYFNLQRKAGTSNIQPTLSYDATSCVSNLLPSPTVIGFNGTKWKDLGITNLTYSTTGNGTVSTASVVSQYGPITLGSYNPLITSTPNGDTCFAAIPMPVAATSTLTGQSQSTGYRWYTFTPTTPEIKITLSNTSMGSNHIHDLLLFEGACSANRLVGYDSSRTDTTLTITLHDAIAGTPYFLMTYKDRPNCSMCSSTADFNLQVKSKTPPSQTVSNGVVSLNGVVSHASEQVIIRVDKSHLNMTNVNNTSTLGGTASQFFDSYILGSIGAALFNSDTSQAGSLTVKKVYPRLTSSDTISLSRDSQLVHIPAFYEIFVLTLPKNTTLFYTSRLLSTIPGVKYAEPDYAGMPASVPNDSLYANQGSLHNTGTYSGVNINVEGAWAVTTGLPFVKIGVYDTGIDGTHVELNGSKIAGGNDFTASGDPAISSGTNHDYGPEFHGTHCAGIIGAYRNNGKGIAGIAGGNVDTTTSNPGCTLYDMKIFTGAILTSDVAPAIEKGATDTSTGGYGLHIMNHSWTQIATAPASTLHDAVQYAVNNGVIFVAARGNFYPSNSVYCTPTPSPATVGDILYPSCFQDEMVINVGASGTDGKWKTAGNGLANTCDNEYFSMTGPGVLLDFVAPGTSALAYTTDSTAYSGFDGTSCAAPHVSGVAALMLSYIDRPHAATRNLVIEDVENILQDNANNIASPNTYDAKVGFGLIDATATMNKIDTTQYKIQHFGVGQNATSTVSTSLANPYNLTIDLNENFGTLAAGFHSAYVYIDTITLHYTLSSSSDGIIKVWPRFSSTAGWYYSGSVSPIVYTDNWCHIVSVTNTKAVLVTYRYKIGGTMYPGSTPQVALSIYTQNWGPAGIKKVSEVDDLTLGIYPNPTGNDATVIVNLTKAQQISLELYDMQGKPVKSIAKEKAVSGLNRYPVSLGDVAAGVYYVRLVTDEASYGKKLIIVK